MIIMRDRQIEQFYEAELNVSVGRRFNEYLPPALIPVRHK